MTPYIIDAIGIEAYGVWVVLQSVVGYYGFVDMGLRASLSQVITNKIARKEFDDVNVFIGSAVPYMAKLGFVIIFISVFVGFFLPRSLHLTPDLQASVWLVVILQAIGFSLLLITQPFNGITVGLQRYDVAEFLGILTRTLWAVSVALALYFKGDLVTLALVSLAVSFIDALIRYLRSLYLLPSLRRVKYSFRTTSLQELQRKAGWNFLIQISRQAMTSTNPLIVGWLSSAVGVVPFSLANSLVDYGTKLIYQPTRMFYPTMVHLKCQGRTKELQSLFCNAVRILTSIAVAYAFAAYFWSVPFLRIWLGDRPDYEFIFKSAPLIVAVVAVRFVMTTFLETGIQLLLANDDIKTLALLSIYESIPSLLLAVGFGYAFGPAGVAAGSLIPMFVLSVGWYIPRILKVLNANTRDLIYDILIPLLVFSSLFGSGLLFYSNVCITPRNPWEFVLNCFIPTALLYFILLPLVIKREHIIKFHKMVRQRLGLVNY
jgi:O-antigen/teichoic acid export membrane protein